MKCLAERMLKNVLCEKNVFNQTKIFKEAFHQLLPIALLNYKRNFTLLQSFFVLAHVLAACPSSIAWLIFLLQIELFFEQANSEQILEQQVS